MQAPFDNIVQHLFHQPSLQSVTVDELERMAEAHPYFAAAHFLLLKKMQQTDHPQFTEQLHKTTLYFNNPLWLQFLLQPETVQAFTVLDSPPFIEETVAPATAAENGVYAAPEASVPTAAAHENEPETMAAEPMPAAPLQHSTFTAPAGIMDVITEVFQEEAPSTAAVLPVAVPHEEKQEATAEALTTGNNEPAVPPISIQETPADTDTVQEESTEEVAVPQDTWLPDPLVALVNKEELHTGSDEENETAAAQESPAAPVYEENANEQAFSHAALPVMAENHEEADATDAPVAEQLLPAETPLLKSIIETPAASTDTLFEPYHTVDYFASQGIKLSRQETDGKDKLGRQLRSFTEWLKTMKRLPQASIDKILSENEESKVVEDAIHSIENKEVITEAMAEVFEKQGMHDKAVEVYQKLSLLNPAKSTYFAAKIAILKH